MCLPNLVSVALCFRKIENILKTPYLSNSENKQIKIKNSVEE
jgi:hypothetical protein